MLSSNDRYQGVVADFDATRGCGTIEVETGERVFVRYSAIHGDGLRSLQRGDRVSFGVEHGRRGLNAVHVIRYQTAP
jgi:CspA family cold shock protein